MSIPQARAGAAYAVIAGSLFAQFGHVIASLGYALGIWLAPSWQAAVAAHAVGTLVGAGVALAITAAALRHVERAADAPPIGVGIAAAGVAAASYVTATVLAGVGAMSLQRRIDAWVADGAPVGDMIADVTYATSALQLAGGLFGLVLATGSLVWLWSRGRVTIPE